MFKHWLMNADLDANRKKVKDLEDKYGLVPCSEIETDYEEGIRRLKLKKSPEVFLFPDSYTSEVVDIIENDETYWNQSYLKVSVGTPSRAGAPIFGVPLKTAFNQALKTGLQKSHYAILRESKDPRAGFLADLIIFVSVDRKSDKNIREIQVWESLLGSEEVFYCHAILNNTHLTTNHLDGAVIYMSAEEKETLFNKATKIKGYKKEKHFRVDAMLPLEISLEIMRAYFPIEELTDEAFELREYAR